MIVSLLDLHPTLPGQSDDKLEIFEAGTGHGALTMNLSRAIHAANTAPPLSRDVEEQSEGAEYKQWLSQRRAVVHTLDISELHSRHAQKTIGNFRGGMYLHNIEFHSGTIQNYLEPRIASEPPFLDRAILDLPNTHLHLSIVSQALKENATAVTFCPSITQVNACVELAKEQDLLLFLESVLEIGGSIGVGGREWDVRRVKVRTPRDGRGPVMTAEQSPPMAVTEESSTESEVVVSNENPDVVELISPPGITNGDNGSDGEPVDRWEMVCRPKVGVRVVGGGFVGLWRKKAF